MVLSDCVNLILENKPGLFKQISNEIKRPQFSDFYISLNN